MQVVRFRRLDGEGKSDPASCFKINSRTRIYKPKRPTKRVQAHLNDPMYQCEGTCWQF